MISLSHTINVSLHLYIYRFQITFPLVHDFIGKGHNQEYQESCGSINIG